MKYTKIIFDVRRGQTLAVLLVFMAIAITITSAAIVMTAINSTATSKMDIGNTALSVATSGAENGVLRLLRDPEYEGETLSLGDGRAYITVSDGTVISRGVVGKFSRTIQVVTGYNDNVLTISSWKEVF